MYVFRISRNCVSTSTTRCVFWICISICVFTFRTRTVMCQKKKLHVKSCISIRVFTFYTHVCMYFVSSRNTWAPAQHGVFLYFLTRSKCMFVSVVYCYMCVYMYFVSHSHVFPGDTKYILHTRNNTQHRHAFWYTISVVYCYMCVYIYTCVYIYILHLQGIRDYRAARTHRMPYLEYHFP